MAGTQFPNETVKGVDYGDRGNSSASVLDCLKNNGNGFVGRYYTNSSTSWKILTKVEAQEISKRGLSIVPVYQESNNSESLFSYDIGKSQAMKALSYALYTIGQPQYTTIYFAVDFEVYAGQSAMNKVKEYFRGVKESFDLYTRTGEGTYYIGVYGNYDVCNTIKGTYGVTKAWQTYAWSGGKNLSGRSLFQQENDITICGKVMDRCYSSGTHGGFKIS